MGNKRLCGGRLNHKEQECIQRKRLAKRKRDAERTEETVRCHRGHRVCILVQQH